MHFCFLSGWPRDPVAASSNHGICKKKTCVIHLRGKTSDEIKSFDDNTWSKVKSCLEKRRSVFKDSKYFHLSLPEHYNESTGYHRQCYKDITAIGLTGSVENDVPSSSTKSKLLRLDVGHITTTSTGVFQKTCLFCKAVTKSLGKGKKESLGSCETDQAEESIKKAAETLQDGPMLAQLGGLDMKAKEVKYHHSCRRSYLSRARSSEQRKGKLQSGKVLAHDKAFRLLRTYISETLIANKGAELLTSLHKQYLNNLEIEDSTYPARSLTDKILGTYPTELKSCKANNKSGLVIYNAMLSEDAADRRACFDDHSVQEAAFYLRTLIMKMQSTQEDLPHPITVEAIKSGQGNAPAALLDFFRVLYSGTRNPSNNERTERLVQSASDDVIFASTHGKIKPAKHMCLGLGLKSMTGSRRVIELLNRFGHSISYHTIETFETELATDISDRNNATPDAIQQISGLCTSLAWDNYDENTETLSGSGTLHDTVGICYQNIIDETTEDPTTEAPPARDPIQETDSKRKISKRVFHLKESNLEPYRKKPKLPSSNTL